MTHVIANLFVDVNPFNTKLTLFVDGNCFLIESTVSEYSRRQMLLRVLADGITRSQRHASNDRPSLKFDIDCHGM